MNRAIIALLLALMLGLSASGCSRTEKVGDEASDTEVSTQVEATDDGESAEEGKEAESGSASSPDAKPSAPGAAATAPPPPSDAINDASRAAREVKVPLYPGAKTEDGMLIPASSGKKGEYEAVMVKQSTGDRFDKVVTFYKGKLKDSEVHEGEEEGRKMALILAPDTKTGEAQVVQVAEVGSRVELVVSRSKMPDPSQAMPDVKTEQNKDKAVKDLGLPLYPNAKVEEGVIMTDANDSSMKQVVVVLDTTAKVNDVVKWYTDKTSPADTQEHMAGDKKIIRMEGPMKDGKRAFSVTVGDVEGKTRVMLTTVTIPAGMR